MGRLIHFCTLRNYYGLGILNDEANRRQVRNLLRRYGVVPSIDIPTNCTDWGHCDIVIDIWWHRGFRYRSNRKIFNPYHNIYLKIVKINIIWGSNLYSHILVWFIPGINISTLVDIITSLKWMRPIYLIRNFR